MGRVATEGGRGATVADLFPLVLERRGSTSHYGDALRAFRDRALCWASLPSGRGFPQLAYALHRLSPSDTAATAATSNTGAVI